MHLPSTKADTERLSLDNVRYADPAKADSPKISVANGWEAYIAGKRELYFWYSPKYFMYQHEKLHNPKTWLVNGQIFTHWTESGEELNPRWKDDTQFIFHWTRGKDSLVITVSPQLKPDAKEKEDVISTEPAQREKPADTPTDEVIYTKAEAPAIAGAFLFQISKFASWTWTI